MTTFTLAMSLLFVMIGINVVIFVVGYWLSFFIQQSNNTLSYQRQYVRTLKSEQRTWQYHTSNAPVISLEG